MKYLLIALLSTLLYCSCNTVARYPIGGPLKSNIDDRLLGKWKFEEDTNTNNFYEVIRGHGYGKESYHVKFWNRGGTNPTYEAQTYFSKIGRSWFLNVPYWEENFTHQGYFFLKIIDCDSSGNFMTTATVYDTTLYNLNSSEEVRDRITAHINDPAYYCDTIHFFKVTK